MSNLTDLHHKRYGLEETCKWIKGHIKQKEDEIAKLQNDLKKVEKDLIIVQGQINDQTTLDQPIVELHTLIKPIDGNDIINRDELLKIYEGMDKQDYTVKYDHVKERYVDLEFIVKKVIENKKMYPNWKLSCVKLTNRVHTEPPKNSYECSYITPDNKKFGTIIVSDWV